eukprot:CAMPEP_0204028348 /NCGR_PEP_ID=MMETSP0360-20130528/52629_1 /ASSEMBLY_ACC=CAM_ASM_000342 /TAXON_ID=268821 /ORGANISM="Scrippsiella Hangoei, Strain SHTV-5" /LENGTH=42 /DNA_ID= /DNA_START= /DNA_END= /DNA_ORIENTATION=
MASQTVGQSKIVMTDDTSTLSEFHEGGDTFKRKCKIICTMGP